MSYFRILLEKATRVNRLSSRKLVTALAALAVAVSPLVGVASPAGAAVDCNALFAGGAGTSGDPWKVSTAAQFSSVRDCGATTGTYFDQINDISLAAYSYWIPIARFLGTYNGHNFKISDLNNSSGLDGAALISSTSRESHITGVNVVVNSVYGKDGTAGLVSQHMGRITSSSVSGGTVASRGTYVGALVAINDGSIENSWASNNVSATGGAVGGLVGINEDGVIMNSYARGNVSAGYTAGGLVGWNYVYNADPSITNSYSTGAVSASTQAGGILGYSSNVGGYTGAAVPFSGKSFWDTVTSGKSIYGTNYPVVALTTVVGKTTSEMKSYATFGPSGGNWKITNGWDVYDSSNKIWGICPGMNNGYPFLLWQDPTGTGCGFPGPPTTASATVGGTTATVSWVAPAIIGSSSITGYTVTSSVGSKTCSATALERSCTVTGLTTGQAYTFTVTATNALGTGSASNPVTVTPMEVPVEVIVGAPTSTRGVGSATVTWTNKVSSNVTGYLVTASPGGASCTALTSTLSAPSCVVSGLTNGTAYTFTVKTTNAAGASLTASSVSNSVIPLSVPGSPGTPIVSSPADSEVTLSWTAPSDNGGSAVTEYTATSSPGSLTCVVSGLTCTISGLTNGTSYSFSVKAKNSEGYGLPSAASSSAIPRTTSDAPTAVLAASHNAYASVLWTAPANNGGAAITSYLVSASPGTGTCVATAPAVSCDVTGLTNGQVYTFTVVAHNSAGDSLSSVPSGAITPLTKPDAPSNAVAVYGDTTSHISWLGSSSDGGSTITHYTVTSSPEGKTCLALAPATSCEVTGLTNGTAYTFTVVAHTAGPVSLQNSDASVASNAVTPRTTPGVPTSVVAIPGNAHAVVTWTAPSSTGGQTISEYQVRAYDSDDVSRGICTVLMPSALSCDVTGLTNGVIYRFGVFAYNSVGYGLRSTLSSSVTPLTKPGVPTAIQVLAGDESALVTWIPPTETGGSSLTSFTATASPGGHTCTAIAPSTICSVPGLTNGVAYTFTVTARSAAFATVGQSDPSSASATVTPRTVPTAPVVNSMTPGNGEFVVSFTPPSSDGGDPITGYEYSRDSGATWHPTASGGTSSPQRITGLTTNTTYSILLRAVNGAGEGFASNAVSAIFVSAPGAPTGLTGVAGNNGAALSWTAPAVTGGRSLVSYTATASPGGASCTVLVPATGCDVTGLTNGVNYTFTVTATSNIGTGVASASSAVLKPLPPGVSETTFEITITVSLGDPVAGGTAEFASSGLEPGTPWSLIVRSTPRLLSSGNAGAAGTILGNAVIPSGLEAGWHSLTLTGRDYLGRDASSTTWFQINAAGELVGSSSVDPRDNSALASTGRDVAPPLQTGILLFLLGALLIVISRTHSGRVPSAEVSLEERGTK